MYCYTRVLTISEPCKADMRGTQVSLKNTPVSLNSTQVSLSSSAVGLMVSIYVGGCSCLASLACLARRARTFGLHASHVWLAGSLARTLATLVTLNKHIPTERLRIIKLQYMTVNPNLVSGSYSD